MLERDLLDRRFENVRANWRNLIIREFWLGCFYHALSVHHFGASVICCTAGLSGKSANTWRIDAGAGAFSNVATTLSWFVFYYKKLADLAATAGRLDVFLNAAQDAAQRRILLNIRLIRMKCCISKICT